MPTRAITMTAGPAATGIDQETTAAAAAVSVACAEGKDWPAPQPSGNRTCTGSARQGRSRATCGLTRRTETRSAAPTAIPSITTARKRCGDLRHRYTAVSSSSRSRLRPLEAADMTKSIQGVPGWLKNASSSVSKPLFTGLTGVAPIRGTAAIGRHTKDGADGELRKARQGASRRGVQAVQQRAWAAHL